MAQVTLEESLLDALREEIAGLRHELRAIAAKLPVSPGELDYGELRAVFGLHLPCERAMRNAVSRGQLSSLKVNGRRLYRLAEVRDWLRGEVCRPRRVARGGGPRNLG